MYTHIMGCSTRHMPPPAAIEYTAAHFFNASDGTTLDLDDVRTIDLPLASRDIRRYLQNLCPQLAEAPRAFNPSIIPMPDGICARCKYLVSLRVSSLHQCSDASRRRRAPASAASAFAANAALALDGDWNLVASTWLASSLENQFVNGSFVGGQRVHDVRLFRFGAHVLATWHCHRCAFLLAKLHVAMSKDEHGRDRLYVWSTVWDKFRFDSKRVHDGAGLQGRNQALASATLPMVGGVGPGEAAGPRGGGSRTGARAPAMSLLVQPWLDVMVVLGQPRFRRVRTSSFPFRSAAQRLWTISGIAPNRRFDPTRGVQQIFVNLTSLSVNAPLPRRRVRAYHSWGSKYPPPPPALSGSRIASPPLLSPTAHLISISRRVLVSTEATQRRQRCTALLGVAHFHRKDGVPPFRWGSEYEHFFYSMAPTPPFRMLAKSRPFCIRAAGTKPAHQTVACVCESVQFISGLALAVDDGRVEESISSTGRLVLAYGVNDCEAKLGSVAMRDVWRG